jgi:hypothetical protein
MLIVEEEQHGEKRANYGKAVVESLAIRFAENGEKGLECNSSSSRITFTLCP